MPGDLIIDLDPETAETDEEVISAEEADLESSEKGSGKSEEPKEEWDGE